MASNLILLSASFAIFSFPCVAPQISFRETLGELLYDRVLLGQVMETFVVRGVFSCAHKCLAHSACKSYNYYATDEQHGVCELNDSDGKFAGNFQMHTGAMFWQGKENVKPKTCLDLLRCGVHSSGIQVMRDNDNSEFSVFCDMNSETGWAWTLVVSQSWLNSNMDELNATPFFKDGRINQDNPNWDAYRLSLRRMELIKSFSSHWRVTCNFPANGLDLRNYLKASFDEFDLLSFKGKNKCQAMEYIGIKGQNCSQCTVGWWQGSSTFLHHDLSYGRCAFEEKARDVAAPDADYFGYYRHVDISFPCTNHIYSTTNHWFGGQL